MELSAARKCREWDSIAKVKISWWLSRHLPICFCLYFHAFTTFIFEMTALLHLKGTEYGSECMAVLQALPGGS